MAKVDQSVLDERNMVDAIRTIVRLKHRIAQRQELNDVEDAWLKEYKNAVAQGKGFELPIESILEG